MKKGRYLFILFCLTILRIVWDRLHSGNDTDIEIEQTEVVEKFEIESDDTYLSETIRITNNDRNLEIYLDDSINNSAKNTSKSTIEIIVKDADSGNILQQLPCKETMDRIELRTENFAVYQTDIVLIYYNSVGEKQSAYLYQWDFANELFFEEAAEIPYQYELVESYNNFFTVTNETENKKEILIYRIVSGKVLEQQKWVFDKPSSYLSIEDVITGSRVFGGNVTLDTEGRIQDEEYLQDIFWENNTPISDIEPESIIKTTCTSDKLPDDEEFSSKDSMLEAYGFVGAEPFYQYYDALQRVQLEFYLNEQTGVGCGIYYDYWYTTELEPKVELIGFAFDSSIIKTWDREAFSLMPVYGDDNGATSVINYKEHIEYRADGKIDYFVSNGEIDWLDEQPVEQEVIEINFIYREDGTLYHRDYFHNPHIFGTSQCTMNSFYDEEERLVYEHAYITHGTLEYYYIYTDEDNKPDYCLCLDWMGRSCWPVLTQYE